MDELSARYDRIFSDYRKVVAPMIMKYEALANKFPIGILNEIRAIFAHLAKFNEAVHEKKIKELSKAEGHLTRLKRDCYKYVCVALEEKFKYFQSHLGEKLIEEGFDKIKEAYKNHEKAIDSLLIARQLELSVDSEDRYEESYEYYERAYNDFCRVEEILKTIITEI